MGKAGRFACIFLPMALTIASLVCLILIFLGSRDSKNSTTNQFWFFRADVSNFTQNPDVNLINGTDIDDNFLKALDTIKTANNLSDFYQVGLWDYCDGNKTNSSGTVSFNVNYCSKPEADYFFNLTEVWGLSGSDDNVIPKALSDGLNAYQKVAHFMFVVYCIALGATAIEIFVGFFAIFSRWGSCVTTLVSSASTLFTILGAITSTVLSSIVIGAINTSLGPYGIHASFGTKMLSVAWLAVAFSLVAGLFWVFSTCCCSGHSGVKRDGGIRRQGTLVEQLPYTHQYRSLGGNAYGAPAGGVPMGDMAHARHQSAGYEPYRNV